ncbi:hypothetical protein [Kribbella sp. CA-293567]|uniref:hypothetical protein n=1 Tax=Kribbella sp. CA-293567 TaxID=3002436 RepID=UPI0022DD9F09|nr:hypothetical protein [Kribbella sp. CA-293567]WBQ06761.1 hypothetical protein OX958_08185 [Kribbella sp. CA-293567]
MRLTGWWLIVPVSAVVLLVLIGGSAGESIRWIATWVIAVLLPGTLLWRALAGGRSLTQDLGCGAVLGLAWQLAVWAVCTALGIPLLQWAFVAGLLVVFWTSKPLRPHLGWRGTSPAPPRWWHVLLVVSLLLAMVRTVFVVLRPVPLPPIAATRHQDIWYQLGLVQQLLDDVTPADPWVLGDPLIYHWFATASMASGSVMADVQPPQVLIHLWPLTMLFTLVLVGWAAGEALSQKAWAAPLAGALAGVLPGAIQLVDTPTANMSAAQVVQGPTGTMAAVVMLGLVGPAVLILRRQASPGVWGAMVLMLALATGTKPTLLPIMLAGCVFAGGFAWLSERRAPWRVVALGGTVAAFLVASSFALTGSTGGSRFQLLAALRVQPYYQAVTGDKTFPATGSWVLPSLERGDARMILFAVVLVAYYLLMNAPRLLTLYGLRSRDPAFWWLSGCVAAGTGVTLVFSHTGYSEYHFLGAVLALGMVGVVAVGVNLAGHAKVRDLVVVAIAGLATAVALYLFWPTDTGTHTVARAAAGLLAPFGVLAVVGAIVILGVNRTRQAASAAVQVMVLTVAAGLPTQFVVIGDAVRDATKPLPAANVEYRTYLSEGEQSAMLWLSKHLEPDDVAVSNVFCMPAPYRPGCPNDAYWMSGLSGVQLWMGGWAYAPANLAATDHRRSFLLQQSPWPDRVLDSRIAVEKPSEQHLAKLAGDVGITLIIGDLRAGPVSPKLDQLAIPVYSNQDIKIYRLK